MEKVEFLLSTWVSPAVADQSVRLPLKIWMICPFSSTDRDRGIARDVQVEAVIRPVHDRAERRVDVAVGVAEARIQGGELLVEVAAHVDARKVERKSGSSDIPHAQVERRLVPFG